MNGYELLPYRGIEAVAKLMDSAIPKHGKDAWRDLPQKALLDKAIEHVILLRSGDTAEDHLSHAACRLLMALEKREESK